MHENLSNYYDVDIYPVNNSSYTNEDHGWIELLTDKRGAAVVVSGVHQPFGLDSDLNYIVV